VDPAPSFTLTIELSEFDGVVARDQDNTESTHAPSEESVRELQERFESLRLPIESRAVSEFEFKGLGTQLFALLFGGKVREFYVGLAERARQVHAPLYIGLVLPEKWQSYPWEMLFDDSAQEFLATSPSRVLYRVVRAAVAPNPPAPSFDITVVAATASDLDSLNTEEEQARLRTALSSGPFTPPKLHIHDGVSRGTLNEVLTETRPGVLHFMGHGRFVPGMNQGAIALEDAEGKSDWTDEHALAAILNGYGQLGLVIMTACETAKVAEGGRELSGVGRRLMDVARVPAVIAMQYKLKDRSAAIFSRAIYAAFSRGEDVAVALQAARKQLQVERTDEPREAFAPVLFLRGQPFRWMQGARKPVLADYGLRNFVSPREYEAFSRMLDQKRALLLEGPPGSGKTFVAQMLMHSFQTREDACEVREVRTLSALREGLGEDKPILFYIEDPWGIGAVGPDTGWIEHLPGFFRKVTGTQRGPHRILVTTRQANLHQVYSPNVPTELRVALGQLTYDSYDRAARARMLELRAMDLQPWQQDFVMRHAAWIADRLRAPLSIERFIFWVGNAKTESELKLERLVQEADVKELGAILKRELDQLGRATRPALFLWTQLCVHPVFKMQEVRSRARLMPEADDGDFDVQKLIGWMTGAGWLQKKDDTYRAHPTTVSGMELVLSSEPDVADRLLGHFLVRLCEAGAVEHAYEIAERLPPDRQAALPSAIRRHVREYLVEQLQRAEGRGFSKSLYAAYRWLADDDHPVSLLVHALLASPVRKPGRHLGFDDWAAPGWTREQSKRVRQSKAAREVLSRYIRFELPTNFLFRLERLIEWTWNLGWNLRVPYQEAFEAALRLRSHAAGGLVHGVLRHRRPGYEAVLLRILKATEELDAEENWLDPELRRKAEQGVLSAAYAEHVLEGEHDAYAALGSALEEFVAVRRAHEGHTWILKHPQRDQLLHPWGNILQNENVLSDRELWDFFQVTSAYAPEFAWRIAAKHAADRVEVPSKRDPAQRGGLMKLLAQLGGAFRGRQQEVDPQRKARIVARIAGDLRTASPKLIDRGLDALQSILSAEEMEATLSKAAASWSDARRVTVALSARRLDRESSVDQRQPYFDAVCAAMGAQLSLVIKLCTQALDERVAPASVARLPASQVAQLQRWALHEGGLLRLASLGVLAELKLLLLPEVQAALQDTDAEVRKVAVRALGYDPSPTARALLRDLLRDRDAGVRKLALTALSNGATPSEQVDILACAKDESYLVREACVVAIQRKHWAAGHLALLELLRDDYNESNAGHPDAVEHRVAYAAAVALLQWEPAPPGLTADLLAFIRGGLSSNEDADVHEPILKRLVATDDASIAPVLAGVLAPIGVQEGAQARQLAHLVLMALMLHLHRWPRHRMGVDAALMGREARHYDPWHAGVALILLGMLGRSADEELRQVLKILNDRWECALLAVLGAIWVNTSPCATAERAAMENADARQLIDWARAPVLTDPADWTERWRAHPNLRASILGARERGVDWFDFLAQCLNVFLGEAFQQSLEPSVASSPVTRAESSTK
jgi:hypothetical protein